MFFATDFVLASVERARIILNRLTGGRWGDYPSGGLGLAW
jgi:hypothetical protein